MGSMSRVAPLGLWVRGCWFSRRPVPGADAARLYASALPGLSEFDRDLVSSAIILGHHPKMGLPKISCELFRKNDRHPTIVTLENLC